VLRTRDEQVKVLQGQVDAHFGRHPDAEIICPSLVWDRFWVPAWVRGRPRPLHRREIPQELCRYHPRSPAPPARRRS
jgi:hypothetical protein